MSTGRMQLLPRLVGGVGVSLDGVQPSRSMFATRLRRVSTSSLRESAFCTSLRNWPHVGQAERMKREERDGRR